jgi:signal transduction histidine kinase
VVKASSVFRDQLDSLHSISVEIASLRELPAVQDRGLSYCLELTESAFGFVGLLTKDRDALDITTIKGFQPSDPDFYHRFRIIPVRRSVFGVVITEERSVISNDVGADPLRVGPPPGHPPVLTFLGVPLRVGETVIGMIGVANRPGGYLPDHEQLLSTFANQIAVAIENSRLYERQREMIARLEHVNRRLDEAERDRVLSQERERIAAGLHDHIEQGIFTIGLQLNVLLEGDVDPAVADRLRMARQLAATTADEVREVIFGLGENGLASGDLTRSLRTLLREVHRTHGLDTDLIVTGEPTPAIAQVANVLYGVVRQALSNVIKHAHARMALVSIRCDSDAVGIVIQDDGVGVSELALRTYERSYLHFGLRRMREEILELGGSFEVANGDDGGLRIRLDVPLAAKTG